MRNIALFYNFAFSLINGEALLPKCAYRPWDLFLCWQTNNKSWYNTGSLFLVDFLLYLESLSRVTFATAWGWGTTSRSSRCQKGHVRYCVSTYLLYGTAYVPTSSTMSLSQADWQERTPLDMATDQGHEAVSFLLLGVIADSMDQAGLHSLSTLTKTYNT